MNNDVLFSKTSDEWTTPQDFLDQLDEEFRFDTDAACTPANARYPHAIYSALDTDWSNDGDPSVCFVNPPYSQCRAFVAKASEEAAKGNTVVILVPSRTDTRWWHEYVWDRSVHAPYPGVEIRFIKGRLKFGNAKNGAPFPSVVIVFRPLEVV